MSITITKSNALAIQAEHVAHYLPRAGVQLARLVAERTHADRLVGEGPHDVVEVNRCIPRGGHIEWLMPHVVEVNGVFYSYGETASIAIADFYDICARMDEGSAAWLRANRNLHSVDLDLASEIAEFMDRVPYHLR